MTLFAGCSENSADEAAYGDAADSPAPGADILYLGESPLTLSPGERALLSFAVRPRGQHAVRFALTGDSGDASLDTGTATSDANGNVAVELTAPSTSRTFTVRATLPLGASAEAPVSVSGIGFGSIEVVASYSGKRRLGRIVGTVATGTSCAELVGIPPLDGPLVGQAMHPRAPVVESAPVGPALVVTARAGQFAGGCMDVKGLRAGETKSVVVPLLDRPLELRDPLVARFELDTEAAVLAWLEASSELSAAAFAGSSEAASLLDAMTDALPPEHQATFAELRGQEDWDAKLTAHFADEGISLATSSRELLLEAARSLELAAGVSGRIEKTTATTVGFEAQALFGRPLEPGTSTPISMTFSATADDVVHLGGELDFSPRALLAEAALDPARARIPSANSVPSALAELVGCAALVEALASEGPVLPECEDSTCLVQACVDGIASMWEGAMRDDELARWKLTASGEAEVGNEAELLGFDGSWVGSIDHDATAIAVKGPTRGEL